MANFITLVRVTLAITAICLLQASPLTNLIGILLITLAMLLDILDGFIARYLKTVSFEGSIYDILGDRIVENVFFIYFASLSCFSVWVALIINLRGLINDALRTIFASKGRTAFGTTSWHTRGWIKLLICSKLSRGAYNAFKLLTFISFAALLQTKSKIFYFFSISEIERIANFSLWSTVTLSLVRSFPILLDAWFLPITPKNEL